MTTSQLRGRHIFTRQVRTRIVSISSNPRAKSGCALRAFFGFFSSETASVTCTAASACSVAKGEPWYGQPEVRVWASDGDRENERRNEKPTPTPTTYLIQSWHNARATVDIYKSVVLDIAAHSGHLHSGEGRGERVRSAPHCVLPAHNTAFVAATIQTPDSTCNRARAKGTTNLTRNRKRSQIRGSSHCLRPPPPLLACHPLLRDHPARQTGDPPASGRPSAVRRSDENPRVT